MEVFLWGKRLDQASDMFSKSFNIEMSRMKSELVSPEIGNWQVLVESTHKQLIGKKKDKSILVVLEPKIVNPLEYRMARMFFKTISISPYFKLTKGSVVWKQGHIKSMTDFMSNRKRNFGAKFEPNSIGIVNENKHSSVRGALYAYRYDSMKELGLADFIVNLAGKNWTKSPIWSLGKYCFAICLALIARELPTFSYLRFGFWRGKKNVRVHGPCLNASEFLSASEFALVIENEATYLSEKLFNAFEAGRIPIYIGPNPASFDIPIETLFHYSGRPESLPEFIKQITPQQKKACLKACDDWLVNNETAERWLVENGVIRLVSTIKDLVKNQVYK